MALKECFALRPRDRIVETARTLFHTHGFRGVGVDTIAEEAGTNKMTLYRHFNSKDDLIVECLRVSAAEKMAVAIQIETDHPTDYDAQLKAFVDAVVENLASDCRGCDLMNAAIELPEADHPALRVVAEFKAEVRAWLARICRGAGLRQPDLVADTLMTLVEGARAARQSDRHQSRPVDFAAMANAVIESFRKVPVYA